MVYAIVFLPKFPGCIESLFEVGIKWRGSGCFLMTGETTGLIFLKDRHGSMELLTGSRELRL
jgi:hypothetical protein